MTSAKEHGRIVLAGIIPARLDLLTQALKELTPEHFNDSVQAHVFRFLEAYYQKTGGILTTVALGDMLSRSAWDAGRKALYAETYEDFKLTKVDDSDFLWSIHELREELAESKVKDMLVESMEIIVNGKELKDGEILKGQEAARDFIAEKMSDIESIAGENDVPHGDLRDEGTTILQEYSQTKQLREQGHVSGIQFGIPELDEKVGGIQRGDLVLSAAYTNDGKTTLCVQLAWSAAVEQGKNVLFLSTETVNTVVRRKLVARHSKHPKFLDHGLPEGLNSKDLKLGTLNPHEEEFLTEVVSDLTVNPEYGHIYIHQVPRFASMDQVERIMYEVQKKFDIDIVICDYLQLLKPMGNRNTDRESLSGVLKNAKQVAVSFNKGKGVAFVSPWQVSRAAKDAADNNGRYTSQALAETAEATNTPDIIVSILAPVDNTDRYTSLSAQVLKHRDGETADGIQLTVDYATSHFSGRGTMDSFATASFVSADTFGSLDSLI